MVQTAQETALPLKTILAYFDIAKKESFIPLDRCFLGAFLPKICAKRPVFTISIPSAEALVLDVGFGEDASTVRKDYAPQNLSLLKKMVLNLVRPVPMGKNGKMSLRMKRKATAWSDEERVRVLGLEPI